MKQRLDQVSLTTSSQLLPFPVHGLKGGHWQISDYPDLSPPLPARAKGGLDFQSVNLSLGNKMGREERVLEGLSRVSILSCTGKKK